MSTPSTQQHHARAQIEQWSRSSERELKVFSLVQATHQLDDLPFDFLEWLAARFAEDADPLLAQHARDLTAATAARRQREAERTYPGTVLAGLPVAALQAQGGVDAKGRPLFEEAALYWLTPLLDRLHDAFEGVTLPRSRVAEAIGRIGWRGSVQVLQAAANDPECADEVVEALARIGGEEATARLITLADDPKFPARVAAIGKLGLCAQPRAGVTLSTAAKKGDPATRRQVAKALGDSKLPEVRTLLPKLLNDVDDVAIEAIHAMGRQHDAIFGAHLVSLGEKTKSAKVRATVVAVLAGFAGPQVAVYVRNAAQDKDARVRANAVEAAGRFLVNPQQARQFYAGLLDDSNHRVAANAVVGLFPLDEQAALERLDIMLASGDAKIRAAGCWAAGAARVDAAKQRLTRSIERESDPKVLQAALRAIEDAADHVSFDSLSRLAVFPRSGVRGLAAKAMARVGGLAAVPALAAMLSGEGEASVRREVVEALAAVPRMEALSYLPDLLSDPNEGVVLGAVRALAATGTLEAAAHLRPMRAHGAGPVRTAATVSLVGLGDLDAVDVLAPALDNKKTADWALAALSGIGELLTVAGLLRHPALGPALLKYHETTVAPHDMRRPKVVAKLFAAPGSKAGGPANPGSKQLPKINIDIEKLIGSAPWEPQAQKPAAPQPANPWSRAIGSGLFSKKTDEEKAEAKAGLVPKATDPLGGLMATSKADPLPPEPLADAGLTPRPVVSALASMPSIPRPGAKAKAPAPTDASPLASMPPTKRGEKASTLGFSALDDLLDDDLDDLAGDDPLDDLGSSDDPLAGDEDEEVVAAPTKPAPTPVPSPVPAFSRPATPVAPPAPPPPATAPVSPQAASPKPQSDRHIQLEDLMRSIYSEPAKALDQAKKQLAAHPADPLVRYLAMKARLTADRRVKLDELKALSNPGQSDVVAVPFQMARIFKEVKRPADTAVWYLDLLGIEISALERVRTEAQRMAGLGRVDEAQKLVGYLASVVPMRPKFHAEIGDACFKAGLPELAFHHLQRAHLSFPEDAQVAFKLARAAQQVGEIDFCRELLERIDLASLPAEEHEELVALKSALSRP